MDLIKQTVSLLEADPLRMEHLYIHKDLNLPDSWIGAGFVRNLIWDFLHGSYNNQYNADIDVLYYDPEDSIDAEAIETTLNASISQTDTRLGLWSVKNQARMHIRNKDAPYIDTIDAMRYWVETCTAVAARLDQDNQIELAAPYGLDDIYNLLIKPTGKFTGDLNYVFRNRIKQKNWTSYWPKLSVIN